MNTKEKDHVEKSGEGFASKVINEIKATAKNTFAIVGIGATLAASVLGISSAGIAANISASAYASDSTPTYAIKPDWPSIPPEAKFAVNPSTIEIPDYGIGNPEAKFINPPIYYTMKKPVQTVEGLYFCDVPIVEGPYVPVAFKNFNENAPEFLYNLKIEGAAYLPLYNNGNMQFFEFGTVDVIFSKRDNNGNLEATDIEQFTFLAPDNTVSSISTNTLLLIEETIPMYTTTATINFKNGASIDVEQQELATYAISAVEQDGTTKNMLLLRNEPVNLISKNNNSDWASYIRR